MDNQIADEGAKAFADGIKENKTLSILDLCKFKFLKNADKNKIHSEGIKALAESIMNNNKTLTKLKLGIENF